MNGELRIDHEHSVDQQKENEVDKNRERPCLALIA
jgi:hypothetical protein